MRDGKQQFMTAFHYFFSAFLCIFGSFACDDDFLYVIENKEDEIVKQEKSKNTDVIFCKKNFWIRTGIILLCYLPVFLAVYPGFFVYRTGNRF